jgi:segregation and condensation protein A
MAAMTDEIYQIHLDNLFEGPMDLLLYLIKKNEVDIYDIPIATITDQYLSYLDWMQAMNVDLAGDFLVMAATLAHIKSRLLLPDAGGDGEEDEDPRMEIARPLLEYLQMKQAAAELARRDILGEHIFLRQPPREEIEESDSGAELVHLGLFELIEAFQRILANLSPAQRFNLSADRISVKDRIGEIVDVLEGKGAVDFAELFAHDAQRGEIVVTFLAILEMVKLCLIRVIQHTQTGAIRIHYL